MESIYKQQPGLFRLPVVAICEWLLVLPATLFIGMPGVVVVAGCAALLRSWRQDQALRHDVAMTLAILRRHFAIGLLTAAVLLAGAILAAVAVHVVTD